MKKTMKKIGIIGHFGGGRDFLDGQTVKTKVLYEELKKRGFENIFCVDTYYNKTNKLKLLSDTLRCIITCDTIIFLLSGNGLKTYLPMLYWAKKMFKRRIYHDVIGGDLAKYVEKNPNSERYLNGIDGNWVEFNKMKEDLEKSGIKNCIVIPNFKTLNTGMAKETPTDEGAYKFCMFSRVMAEKGMTLAAEAIARYNESHQKKAELEIWGPVDDRYKEEFDSLLGKYGEWMRYMGCVAFDKSVETLTDHIALLFPTYWRGEGFPGTIIDAYTAAVPVIASDWNANSELVMNFETGWVYPNDKIQTLDQSIEWAIEHKDEMIAMRKNCSLVAKHYSADYVMGRIMGELKK